MPLRVEGRIVLTTLKAAPSGPKAVAGLPNERSRKPLDFRTPYEVFAQGRSWKYRAVNIWQKRSGSRCSCIPGHIITGFGLIQYLFIGTLMCLTQG
jgi:hypothetical protein